MIAACLSVTNAFVTNFYVFLVIRIGIGFTVFPPFSSAFVLGEFAPRAAYDVTRKLV